MLYPYFGNGLFNSEGPDWEKQRKVLQALFSKPQVAGWCDLVVEETENQLDGIGSGSTPFQVESAVQKLMQRIMSRILFGLTLDDNDSVAVVKAIENVSERMADHGLKSFILCDVLNKLPTPSNIHFQKKLLVIDQSIEKISN